MSTSTTDLDRAARPALADLKAHYDGYYGEQALTRRRSAMARTICANLRACWQAAAGPLPPPVRVADLGCGDGAVLEALSEGAFGCEYVGYEISSSALRCARERVYRQPVSFLQFDGRSVPAPDREYDLCILSHVLEHVEAPRLLLSEAARIARHVYVEVPLELNLRAPRNFRWKSTGHINLFNSLMLRHLVQTCDLAVFHERTSGPSLESYALQRSLWTALPRWALKNALLGVCPWLAPKLLYYHGSLLAGHRP